MLLHEEKLLSRFWVLSHVKFITKVLGNVRWIGSCHLRWIIQESNLSAMRKFVDVGIFSVVSVLRLTAWISDLVLFLLISVSVFVLENYIIVLVIQCLLFLLELLFSVETWLDILTMTLFCLLLGCLEERRLPSWEMMAPNSRVLQFITNQVLKILTFPFMDLLIWLYIWC